MRWAAGIAAFAAVCLAAGCSGSSGNAPSSDPPHFVPSTPVTSSSAPSKSTSTPTAPATPSVPADVPTTGPNVTGPSERPPIEPILATQHSAAGAKAFAEFFIRTIDWGYATTSSAYMRHYFEPSCEQCEVVARLLDNAKRMGDSYIGGRLTINHAELSTYGERPTVDMSILVTALEAVDRSGKPKAADPAVPDYREHAVLLWREQGWQIVDLLGKK